MDLLADDSPVFGIRSVGLVGVLAGLAASGAAKPVLGRFL